MARVSFFAFKGVAFDYVHITLRLVLNERNSCYESGVAIAASKLGLRVFDYWRISQAKLAGALWSLFTHLKSPLCKPRIIYKLTTFNHFYLHLYLSKSCLWLTFSRELKLLKSPTTGSIYSSLLQVSHNFNWFARFLAASRVCEGANGAEESLREDVTHKS